MTSKLLQTSLQEAENQTDLSLREAHTLLKPLLKPPFPLSIPTHSEYLQLNRAIAYAILTEPGLAHTHFTHLAAIITDGYEFFVNLLIQIAIESYPKLLVPARVQLIWACSKLVGVSAIGVENLLLSLLRQINGGDFSQPNLWLAMELIQIFSGNWDWVVSEHLLLTSGLYTYLRLLADHYRLSGPELDELKRSEIEFCIRALRECFGVCLRIGRDLLRLLQDLSHIPEFRDVWKDLLSNPAVFRVPGFSDISQIYHSRTSTSTLSAILKQRLCIFIPSLKLNAAREALADHPHYPVPLNLSIPSNVEGMPLNLPSPSDVGSGKMSTQFNVEDVPLNLPSPSDVGSGKMSTRFNVEDVPLNLSGPSDVGSGKKSTPSNVEGVPLNLSSPFAVGGRKTSFKDSELSKCHRENGSRKKPIVEGIQVSDSLVASTSLISKKRKIAVMGNLVHDLGAIVKQSNKQGLDTLENILFSYAALNNQVLDPAVVGDSDCSPQALAFQVMEAFKCNGYEMFSPLKCPLKEINHDEEVHSATALVIRTFIFSPHERMNDILLFWYEKGHPVGPRLLSYVSRLANEAHATSGLGSSINCHNHINHLSHDGNLLRGYAMTRNNQNASVKENNLGDSLLKRHVDAYFSFMNVRGKGTPDSVILASTVDLKLISQLVTDAFVAYKIYLKSCSIKQSSPDVETLNGICQTNNVSSNGVKGTTQTLVSSLFSDLRSCCGLQAKRSRSLFCSIFCHLSDLSSSKEEFVRLLVDRLDHVDLVATQFDIGLKRFSIFGEDTVMICHLVRTTLTWDSAEQQKFWSLLMSELAVSKVQVEKIVMDLCSDLLDPREDSVAVGGLLQLSRCCSPTPEFVGTIISLPDAFSDFAAAVLASWASSSGLMLSNSLAEWLEKLNSNYDAISAKINYSAITELSKFLDAEGMRSANGLSEISERISNVQSKLANGGV